MKVSVVGISLLFLATTLVARTTQEGLTHTDRVLAPESARKVRPEIEVPGTQHVIVGGRPTTDDGPPGTAFMIYEYTDEKGKTHTGVCTATVMKNGCFISAGHCCPDKTCKGKVRIYFGKEPDVNAEPDPGLEVDATALLGSDIDGGKDIMMGRLKVAPTEEENRKLTELDELLCNAKDLEGIEGRHAAIWGYGATESEEQNDGTYKNNKGVGRLRIGDSEVAGVGSHASGFIFLDSKNEDVGKRSLYTKNTEKYVSKVNGGDSGGGMYIQSRGKRRLCAILSGTIRTIPGTQGLTGKELDALKKKYEDVAKRNAAWQTYAAYTPVSDHRKWIDEKAEAMDCNRTGKKTEKKSNRPTGKAFTDTATEIQDTIEQFHNFKENFDEKRYQSWKKNNSEEPLHKLLYKVTGIDPKDHRNLKVEMLPDKNFPSIMFEIKDGDKRLAMFYLVKQPGKDEVKMHGLDLVTGDLFDEKGKVEKQKD